MARARGRFGRGIRMAEPDHLRSGNNDSRTGGSGTGREKRAPNQKPRGQQYTTCRYVLTLFSIYVNTFGNLLTKYVLIYGKFFVPLQMKGGGNSSLTHWHKDTIKG